MPPAKKAAARSGNPAKKAAAVTSIADIKRRRGGLMQLPSGITVKLYNPGGMKVFVEAGTIPNSLMGIVQENLDKGKGKPAQDIAEQIIGPDGVDEELVNEMIHMMNVVAAKCIVEPEVHMPPDDNRDRDDNLLYADELDDEDKMFIFQWVTGGTQDIEQFRSELRTELVAMDGLQDVGHPTKRTSRPRKR